MKSLFPVSWSTFIGEQNLEQFNGLFEQLDKLYSSNIAIFPPKNQVFRALDFLKPDEVKVLILGQDPYPTRGHAHGFCFSCHESVRPLPKSLNNIFKELYSDLGILPSAHGNLESWAKQGVLLLNTILTVEEGSALSHKKLGWQKLTDLIIQQLAEKQNNIVFLLWGNEAQKKTEFIPKENHLILAHTHPSPLSASRGFFGSKPFSKINNYLEQHGRKAVNWELPTIGSLF